MAQVVGYWEDNVTFTEGPFVMVSAGGWRTEVEWKGYQCPILPSNSVYELLEKEFVARGEYIKEPGVFLPLTPGVGKTNIQELAAEIVDWLNSLVKEGRIIEDNKGAWVCPEYEK